MRWMGMLMSLVLAVGGVAGDGLGVDGCASCSSPLTSSARLIPDYKRSIGEQLSILVTLRQADGSPTPFGGEEVDVYVTANPSPNDGGDTTFVPVQITDMNNGTYLATFSLHVQAEYTVSMRILHAGRDAYRLLDLDVADERYESMLGKTIAFVNQDIQHSPFPFSTMSWRPMNVKLMQHAMIFLRAMHKMHQSNGEGWSEVIATENREWLRSKGLSLPEIEVVIRQSSKLVLDDPVDADACRRGEMYAGRFFSKQWSPHFCRLRPASSCLIRKDRRIFIVGGRESFLLFGALTALVYGTPLNDAGGVGHLDEVSSADGRMSFVPSEGHCTSAELERFLARDLHSPQDVVSFSCGSRQDYLSSTHDHADAYADIRHVFDRHATAGPILHFRTVGAPNPILAGLTFGAADRLSPEAEALFHSVHRAAAWSSAARAALPPNKVLDVYMFERSLWRESTRNLHFPEWVYYQLARVFAHDICFLQPRGL